MTRSGHSPAGIVSRRVRSALCILVPMLVATTLVAAAEDPGVISTAAGNGRYGDSGDGGPATEASLRYAFGVAAGPDGSIYVADTYNHRIRRIDPATGVIDTVVGTGQEGFGGDGGPAGAALLNHPHAVLVDEGGNLYIADSFNHRIRYVDAATGRIATVAGDGREEFAGDGGPATAAALNQPTAVGLASDGHLYVADALNNRIRRVDRGTGVITTVAGNGIEGFSGDGGPATAASLAYPFGLAFDPDGNLYISDLHNHRVRRVDRDSGVITTVAGTGTQGDTGDGGPAVEASLAKPSGIASSEDGSLFVADSGNGRVRRIDAATGVITTVAGDGSARGLLAAHVGYYAATGPELSQVLIGDGGPATEAALSHPIDVAFDAAGNLFVADVFGHRVRRIQGPL